MLQHLKKVFIAEIIISCLTCFQRADYNLPLFTFAYFLWDYKSYNSQKIRLFYLFVGTWIVDFVWLVYWGITWGSDDYKLRGPSGPASFVLVLSIISFVLKLSSQCRISTIHKLFQQLLILQAIQSQYFRILLKEIMIDYIHMNPKKNQTNWASCGMLIYPFYIAKELDRMNLLNSFSWIKAEGESDLPSQKYLDFLISGTPIDMRRGRVERYQINIQQQDEKGVNLHSPPAIQYKYQYPVIKTEVCQDMMAVRTKQDGVFINKLNKPFDITKLKFTQPAKQNQNKTLAWRSDRQAILAASNSKLIYVWDVNTQKCRNTIQYYKKDITDLVWLNQKYFASASYGGKICLWSINQPKPICGLSDSIENNQNASTSLSVAKSGSIDEAIILSGTDRVITLWQKGTKSKIQFRGEHHHPITKIRCSGVACKQRLFAALDSSGRIVLYDRNGKQSVYNNPQTQMNAYDFSAMNGFYGVICQTKYMMIWSPVSNRSLNANFAK